MTAVPDILWLVNLTLQIFAFVLMLIEMLVMMTPEMFELESVVLGTPGSATAAFETICTVTLVLETADISITLLKALAFESLAPDVRVSVGAVLGLWAATGVAHDSPGPVGMALYKPQPVRVTLEEREPVPVLDETLGAVVVAPGAFGFVKFERCTLACML